MQTRFRIFDNKKRWRMLFVWSTLKPVHFYRCRQVMSTTPCATLPLPLPATSHAKDILLRDIPPCPSIVFSVTPLALFYLNIRGLPHIQHHFLFKYPIITLLTAVKQQKRPLNHVVGPYHGPSRIRARVLLRHHHAQSSGHCRTRWVSTSPRSDDDGPTCCVQSAAGADRGPHQ